MRWTMKAFKPLSKRERNGKLIIFGELNARGKDVTGVEYDFYGGNMTITRDSKQTKMFKKLNRHINNKCGNGLSNPLPKDINPIHNNEPSLG